MTYRRRMITAWGILRGRPPRPDYGLLLVMPFLAAAGGSLIASVIDSVVESRRGKSPAAASGPDSRSHGSSAADEARAVPSRPY
ncbi:hypothetical protein AB0J80_29220 [Actinoplanes sp. NPDC049548]|uniref:hypothetical protein n=1 Tax=Actinoplanes sp. NPDC049548 TaxID=3155152 RepID=UPI0034239A72